MAVNFCGSCGARAGAARFCEQCGNRLSDDAQESTTLRPFDPGLAAAASPAANPTSEPAPDAPSTWATPPSEEEPPTYAPPSTQDRPPTWAQTPSYETPTTYSAPPPTPAWSGTQAPAPTWSQPPTGPGEHPDPAEAPDGTASGPSLDLSRWVDPSDLARDLGALFFLFGALALPWSTTGDGSQQWWVVLATVVAALAVLLPHLLTAKVLPTSARGTVALARLGLQVPLLVSVLVVLVAELITLTDSSGGGIGMGVGLGLAGAILAAQPRRADESGSPGPWRLVSVVAPVVGFGLLGLGTAVGFLQAVTNGFSDLLDTIGYLVLIVAAPVAVWSGPLVGHLGRSRAATRALGVVGLGYACVVLLAGDGGGAVFGPTVTKVVGLQSLLLPPTGEFLLVAAAAAAVARPVLDRSRTPSDTTSWVRTASLLLATTALGLGVAIAGRVLLMVSDELYDAASIAVSVLMLLGVIAALVGRAMLVSDPDRRRVVAVGIAGLLIVVGIVVVAVSGEQVGDNSVLGIEALCWFVLPAGVLWSLLAPAVVRRELRPLAPSVGPQQP